MNLIDEEKWEPELTNSVNIWEINNPGFVLVTLNLDQNTDTDMGVCLSVYPVLHWRMLSFYITYFIYITT